SFDSLCKLYWRTAVSIALGVRHVLEALNENGYLIDTLHVTGGHTKNLFLKDKKDNFFLVSVDEEAVVDLKQIHHLIGAAGRVSFGRPEMLMELLGVVPGAVTVFGLINDTDRRVKVVLDAELMSHAVVNAHPLTNEATTSIATADLIKFVEATGHDAVILKVSA
ncbi:MAG: hypothetical protein E5V36_22360, partial [Mesorhizobium sp.]